MGILLLALLLGAAVSNVSAVCTGRVGQQSFVGDVTPTDHVLQFTGAGYVDMPAAQIGSSFMTFITQVYTPAGAGGCLFSFQNGQDQSAYIEARITGQSVSFKAGTPAPVSSFNTLPLGQWNTIAVVVDNTARRAAIYINGLHSGEGPIGAIPMMTRKPAIGLCAAAPRYFTGSMDNFMVIAEKRTPVELGFFGSQYFPIVPENNLVAYYDFNSWVASTDAPAWEGTAAVPASLDAVVQVMNSSPVRKLKAQVGTTGTTVTDKQCGFLGGINWDETTSSAKAPFYGIQGGGYTESFSCNTGGAQRFAMMEKWHEALGLTEVSLFTSMDHRWRVFVGANGLEVLHQNWGGWERIGVTTEFVEDDGITFQITNDAFKVQVAGYGWARIYKSGQILAYDFALSTTTCNNGVPSTRDYCQWSASDVTKYQWSGTPLPEPMGVDAVGAPGVGGNPAVLACPTWGHDYRPQDYCTLAGSYGDSFCCQYAQHRARPVCFASYPVDYCNAHPEDSACCPIDPSTFGSRPVCLDTYPEIYCNTPTGLGNDACCTKGYGCRELCWNNYPGVYCPCHKDQLRCCPWNPSEPMCVAQQAPSPPPPPPSPIVEPPFVPSDPCGKLANGDANAKAQYAAIVTSCNAIWTSTDSSGRRQCLAVSCTIGDNVPPPPDCKTAQMLNAANPSYTIPATCNGCPNGCSFQGTCNTATRVCTCSADFSGPDCSIPKKYPCWTVKTGANPALSVQPIQLFYTPPSTTPLLTSSFNWYAVENFNAPFANRIPDSVTIVPVYTLADWTTRSRDYHLFITGGNQATNTAGGSANVVISGSSILKTAGASGYEYNVLASGTNGGVATCSGANRLLANSANTISCTMSWPVGGQATITLVGLTPTSDFTVTVDTTSQVLTAGNARQSTRVVEVLRQIPTSGNSHAVVFHNENCNAPAACNQNNCADCAAQAACGWCVELNTCMPGGRSGPAVGTCNNWRFTFDTDVSRRLTQVPSFPTNPGTTDVYTTSADSLELPIELSVIVSPDSTVPWDVVVLGQVDSVNRNAWSTAMSQLQGELTNGYPNLQLGFGALTASGYRFLLPGTNPNAYGLFGNVLNLCSVDCQAPVAAASLNVRTALQTLGDPATNEFNYRIGFNTRRIAIVMSTAAVNAGDTATAVEIRKRLLSKGQIVPIFAVPSNVAAGYSQLVTDLGFGAVVDLDASWNPVSMKAAIFKAIKRAAYQVSLTHVITASNSIIDTAAFAARAKSMTINGLAPDSRLSTEYRAKFFVPVKGTNNPVSAQLYVPGFAQAAIENVATDRPTFVGVQTTYDVEEANADGLVNPVVIQLPGQSFRNLYKVVSKVTAATKVDGTWNYLFSGIKNSEPYYGAGDVIANPVGQVIAEGAIVYTPPALTVNGGVSAKGKTYGDNFASITYQLYDYCTVSLTEQTITINVKHVNHPPYAQAIPAHGDEYTPIIVTLDAADVDGDAVEYYIAGTPVIRDSSPASREDAGKIYQYSATFDPKAPAGEITAPNTKLNENRLIYVPPRFAHSFADPVLAADRLLIPCLSYYVKETATEELYASQVVDVPITIDHVNNAPWVFNDPQHPTELDHSWNFGEMFPSQAQGVNCWGGYNAPTCNWQEDFGEEFWWQTLHRQIFFGGYDVEGSRLDIEISGIDCYPGTSILAPLSSTTESINVGAVIRSQNNDVLVAALRMKPVPETYDAHFAPKPYYCKIAYRVRDQDDAVSLNEGSITINIAHVNKQPRVTENDVSFTAYELTPFQFQIKVVDPEDDDFTMTLVSCEFNRGTYLFCNDEACTQTTEVDCASATPQVIPRTSGAEFPMGQFTSAKLGEISEGIEYNTLTFKFEDQESEFPVRAVKVIFNVIKLNTPPVVTLDGEIANQHLRSVEAGAVYTAKFAVDDADAEQGILTARVTLENALAPTSKLDMASFPEFAVQIGENDIGFDADLYSLQQIIQSINVLAPQQAEAGSASAVLTLTVNDNGNTGQCPTDTFLRTSSCPLETKTSVVITWTKPSDSTAAMIGGSSAAAAFGAIGAIAAAVLFRRAQSKAQDNYQPWDASGMDEAVVDNPLYQGDGNNGENPLFEAPTNHHGM